MKAKISQIFDYFPGNHGLTEEIIYQYQPDSHDDRVPIFSGSKDNIIPVGFIRKKARNKEGKDVIYFDGPCLILTKDGSAGLLTHKDTGVFTINHHACVLKLKTEWKNRVNLEWFSAQYQKNFYQYVTSKSDNRVFSTEWFEKILFEIPDYNVQIRQKNKRKKIDSLILDITKLMSVLSRLTIESNIELKEGEYYPIKDIFYFKGGNSGLTEEFIYYNLPGKEDEKIPILSSATLETNLMGYISRSSRPSGKKLRVFSAPCVLVARNGYAGTMTYIANGDFTTNDHAYVLTPKKDWKDKINLRWFVFQYQELFHNLVTSKSDNATFNKEYAEKQTIRIPNIDFQKRISEKLKKIDALIQNLKELKEKADKLVEYQIT